MSSLYTFQTCSLRKVGQCADCAGLRSIRSCAADNAPPPPPYVHEVLKPPYVHEVLKPPYVHEVLKPPYVHEVLKPAITYVEVQCSAVNCPVNATSELCRKCCYILAHGGDANQNV